MVERTQSRSAEAIKGLHDWFLEQNGGDHALALKHCIATLYAITEYAIRDGFYRDVLLPPTEGVTSTRVPL